MSRITLNDTIGAMYLAPNHAAETWHPTMPQKQKHLPDRAAEQITACQGDYGAMADLACSSHKVSEHDGDGRGAVLLCRYVMTGLIETFRMLHSDRSQPSAFAVCMLLEKKDDSACQTMKGRRRLVSYLQYHSVSSMQNLSLGKPPAVEQTILILQRRRTADTAD